MGLEFLSVEKATGLFKCFIGGKIFYLDNFCEKRVLIFAQIGMSQ